MKAHDNIVSFFQEHKVSVKRQAFELDTSLLAEYGSGGQVVTFCAEYDALPDIGHGCGHNLIAVASIAAFFGVRAALSALKLPGRVRLLGCPAEEGGGGKIKLIWAGAFKDTDAALMIHPCPAEPDGMDGISYGTCLSTSQYKVIFTGLSAHAGAMPWMGINALDAATLSYSAVSMLRQQIKPTDRINIIIEEGGTSSNVIAHRAVVKCGARSATKDDLFDLLRRTRSCFEGAAIATQCTVCFVDEYVKYKLFLSGQLTMLLRMEPYADLRPNKSLCSAFSESMEKVGEQFSCNLDQKVIGGYSTDMGTSYQLLTETLANPPRR